MINIIDHAWQFELKNYQILPTVIKFDKNLPKSYFYSHKNSRILRKKDQSLESSIQFLSNPQQPYQNYLLVTHKSKDKIQFSFILQSQLYDILKNQSNNVAIIKLEQHRDKTLIIECSFDIKGKIGIKYLMQYDKSRLFWSIENSIEISTGILQKYMINLWKELPQIMKIQSKCQKIQLILSITPSLDQIYLLWCNLFSFSNQEFYQIKYQYTIKQMAFQKILKDKFKLRQTPNTSKEIISFKFQKTNTEYKQQAEIFSKQSQKEPTKQTKSAVCNGCGRQFEQEKGKQVPNSDVIGLRRRKKLSIMGILAEYLLICQQCYYSIDQ